MQNITQQLIMDQLKGKSEVLLPLTATFDTEEIKGLKYDGSFQQYEAVRDLVGKNLGYSPDFNYGIIIENDELVLKVRKTREIKSASVFLDGKEILKFNN